MKLSKKEKNKIEAQMTVVRRDNTWVGLRPAVFKSKKYDKKCRRAESKRICMAY